MDETDVEHPVGDAAPQRRPRTVDVLAAGDPAHGGVGEARQHLPNETVIPQRVRVRQDHDRLGGCEDPDGKGMPLPRWLDDDDLQLVVVLRPSVSERDQVVLGVIDHEEDLLDVVRAPAL